MISQHSIDLIVSCEVSSRATYERNYRHPEWPGGRSGVTVAIGYDLGYASLAKLHADWDGKLAPEMIRVMERCLGVTGEAARQLLPSVRSQIDVPWDVAMAVFLDRDVPEWTNKVIRSIPAAAQLPPDSLGALVSLAYNRGASFDNTGDRYREMRAIKQHTMAMDAKSDPAEFRSMKRLWPGVHGLLARRDAEARLFEQGLRAPSLAPEKHAAPETPPPLPPAPAGIKEHGSSGGVGAAAGKAIQETVPPEHIWSIMEIALTIGGVIALMIIAWLIVRAYRKSQPVLARAKDAPAELASAIS